MGRSSTQLLFLLLLFGVVRARVCAMLFIKHMRPTKPNSELKINSRRSAHDNDHCVCVCLCTRACACEAAQHAQLHTQNQSILCIHKRLQFVRNRMRKINCRLIIQTAPNSKHIYIHKIYDYSQQYVKKRQLALNPTCKKISILNICKLHNIAHKSIHKIKQVHVHTKDDPK